MSEENGPKTYSYVFFKNPDNVTSPGKKGHKFSVFKAAPETWVFEGFPDLQTWLQLASMTLMMAPNGGSTGFVLKLGMCKLHHKDTFSKKEGVRFAKEKMVEESFIIRRVIINPHNIDNSMLEITMESDKTRIFVNVYSNGKPKVINARRKSNA